jgi:hypothetical protein
MVCRIRSNNWLAGLPAQSLRMRRSISTVAWQRAQCTPKIWSPVCWAGASTGNSSSGRNINDRRFNAWLRLVVVWANLLHFRPQCPGWLQMPLQIAVAAANPLPAAV